MPSAWGRPLSNTPRTSCLFLRREACALLGAPPRGTARPPLHKRCTPTTSPSLPPRIAAAVPMCTPHQPDGGAHAAFFCVRAVSGAHCREPEPFSDIPCEVLRTKKTRHIFYRPEPDCWMTIVSGVGHHAHRDMRRVRSSCAAQCREVCCHHSPAHHARARTFSRLGLRALTLP